MNKVTKLTYSRCSKGTITELRVFREFIQVFHNGEQVAAFHNKSVRALLGERKEDAQDSGAITIIEDHEEC